jgi:hypothetical protein
LDRTGGGAVIALGETVTEVTDPTRPRPPISPAGHGETLQPIANVRQGFLDGRSRRAVLVVTGQVLSADHSDPQLRVAAALQPDPENRHSGHSPLAVLLCTEHQAIISHLPSPRRVNLPTDARRRSLEPIAKIRPEARIRSTGEPAYFRRGLDSAERSGLWCGRSGVSWSYGIGVNAARGRTPARVRLVAADGSVSGRKSPPISDDAGGYVCLHRQHVRLMLQPPVNVIGALARGESTAKSPILARVRHADSSCAAAASRRAIRAALVVDPVAVHQKPNQSPYAATQTN